MPAWPTISLFLVTALVLLLIPGPAVLYIITRGVHQGRRAAVASTLGIELGNVCYVAATALGLSALLLSSALLFSMVKYLGAAYLLYLGVRTLLSGQQARQDAVPPPLSLPRVFGQGFLVQLLNPKTALFFVAFLPQFIDPARGAVTGQILFFGCLFCSLSVCTDSLYALAASTLGGWLRGKMRFQSVRRYLTAGVYLGLGLWAALVGPQHVQHGHDNA
jgi:threonine/homoserine/homoserine lactone efflux protein